jgi:archaellum component FlaF (FlaF/FlaG flagellin family)
VCRYGPNRRRITVIATVVGSVLVGINQGTVLAAGRLSPLVWVRIGLDYLIPACVSTMGVLAGTRRSSWNRAGGAGGADTP